MWLYEIIYFIFEYINLFHTCFFVIVGKLDFESEPQLEIFKFNTSVYVSKIYCSAS